MNATAIAICACIIVVIALVYFILILPREKKISELDSAKSSAEYKCHEQEKSISTQQDKIKQLDIELSSAKKELENMRRIQKRNEFLESTLSNKTAIPYLAGVIADYETYGIEHLASELNWGYDQQRLKKVQSIREIREEARQIVERHKIAEYQLKYLLELYPALQDVIEADYSSLPIVKLDELTTRDPVHDYLSKEEYNSLTESQRNQLALDRYIASHNKTKWQIGRDYEQYIGYLYTQQGQHVEYFGENKGLEDLGRDLIVTRSNGHVDIVQCKYWSALKQIHEKHVTQLYGTVASYCIEHGISPDKVRGVLVTNIELSPMAKKMAEYLGITYRENVSAGNYPRIKCNNGKDEYGFPTKIYHLPFDQQYDVINMDKSGNMFVTTVKEAEQAGYRRAYKWFGN